MPRPSRSARHFASRVMLLRRPIPSADLNRALRDARTYEEFRTAIGKLCRIERWQQSHSISHALAQLEQAGHCSVQPGVEAAASPNCVFDPRRYLVAWTLCGIVTLEYGNDAAQQWPREISALLITPVLQLTYLSAAYRACAEQRSRWPLWRFRCGTGCRRHDTRMACVLHRAPECGRARCLAWLTQVCHLALRPPMKSLT